MFFNLINQGKDFCVGDSGGPMVMKSGPFNELKLIGIISWGPDRCGETNVSIWRFHIF